MFQHVEETWILSNLWGSSTWSAYRQTIRTNSDVEGWHQALNTAARTKTLEFYKLVALLAKQAVLVTVQTNKWIRNRMKNYYNVKDQDTTKLTCSRQTWHV